jgi:hypothetical protein
LVAKYTYKILSANVGFVGSPAIRIPTDSINKYQKSDQYIQLGLRPLMAQSRRSASTARLNSQALRRHAVNFIGCLFSAISTPYMIFMQTL